MTARRLPPALEEKAMLRANDQRVIQVVYFAEDILDWLYGKDVPVYVDDVFAGHETSPDVVERVRERMRVAAQPSPEGGKRDSWWETALRAELGMEETWNSAN